jgi:hypothetical protein
MIEQLFCYKFRADYFFFKLYNMCIWFLFWHNKFQTAKEYAFKKITLHLHKVRIC